MWGWFFAIARTALSGYTGAGALGVVAAVGAVMVVGQTDLAESTPPRHGVLLPFSFQTRDLGSAGPLIYGTDPAAQNAAFDAEQRALPRLTASQLIALPVINSHIVDESLQDSAAFDACGRPSATCRAFTSRPTPSRFSNRRRHRHQ